MQLADHGGTACHSGQFRLSRQPHRRQPVGQPEGLLEIDVLAVVLVFLPRVENGAGRIHPGVVCGDPAVDGSLVAHVNAVGRHRLDEGTRRPPVRRVHHRVGEPGRDLVKLAFQLAGGGFRHSPAFGEVGEEVAHGGDRVLGVGAVKHRDLARVDAQQQFLEVTLAEVGGTLDAEVVPHQVKQGLQLISVRTGVTA